jgi:hypothetical protein
MVITTGRDNPVLTANRDTQIAHDDTPSDADHHHAVDDRLARKDSSSRSVALAGPAVTTKRVRQHAGSIQVADIATLSELQGIGPVWLRLRLDLTHRRLLHLRMITAAHFMTQTWAASPQRVSPHPPARSNTAVDPDRLHPSTTAERLAAPQLPLGAGAISPRPACCRSAGSTIPESRARTVNPVRHAMIAARCAAWVFGR